MTSTYYTGYSAGYAAHERACLQYIKWSILLTLFIAAVAWASGVRADELPDTDRLANAIYRAENSVKYPYGIRSINTHGDKAVARRICINSINNAKARYRRAGARGSFIEFMGRRYSPPASNPNWVRLVKYFYNKGE